MLIAARNSFLMGGARLPYDAEVEHLERITGSGMACDLGVNIADNNWVIECDCYARYVTTGWNGAYQAYVDESHESTRVLVYNRDVTKAYAGYRRRSTAQTLVTLRNGWQRRALYRLSYMSLVVRDADGEYSVALDPPSDTLATGTPLGIWMTGGAWVIYSFRAYHNNALVRDLIPVRVGSGSSAVGYLYDHANPTGGPLGNGLYPNAGTGAFVVGPDKP